MNQINLLGNPNDEKRGFWFQTPETCKNPERLNAIEREIYDAIVKFEALEKINPTTSENDRNAFLKNFVWEKSV